MKKRTRIIDEFSNLEIFYTDNTSWLEDISPNSDSLQPDELLSELEDQLESGEITQQQLIDTYKRNYP